MNYVTDDTMNAYLRTVQPLFDGVLGEIQREAMAADVPIVPPEVARFISVLLTMLAGLIPARSAAKKDPVVALRTE